MKEHTSNIKQEEIVDFAFNPETRKKGETLGGMIQGNAPMSPTMQRGSVFSQSLEGSLQNAINDTDRKKAHLKQKPLPNVVYGKLHKFY